MARKYQRPVKRYPKPHGYVMPKPGNVRPGTVNDKRQISLFDPPKRSYVEQPLTPELATQILIQTHERLEQQERDVLLMISRGLVLNPHQREILNSIFAKLGPQQ